MGKSAKFGVYFRPQTLLSFPSLKADEHIWNLNQTF